MKLLTSFNKTKKCPNCGAELDSSLIICTNCGTAIIKKPGFFNHLFFSMVFAMIAFAFGYFVIFNRISLSSGILTDHLINLAIIFVAFWELFFIILKAGDFFVQRKGLNFFKSHDVLKLFIGNEKIKISNIEIVLSKIYDILKKQGFLNILDLIIFERVRKTLYFLKAVPTRDEISSTLSYQAEIDQSRQDVEFKLLKVFNWALPTMGFFGTVLGIGEAINKFSTFLGNAGTEITTEAIKNNLTGVISGLGMAFDSTMLALLFLLIILPIGAYLENQYDSLLNQIEEYCLTFITPNLEFDDKHNEKPGDL